MYKDDLLAEFIGLYGSRGVFGRKCFNSVTGGCFLSNEN